MTDTMIEKPFEYLRRLSTGERFEQATVDLWYEARAYVIDKLEDVAFKADAGEHLHAVVASDSPAMLSVVRQIALLAHYINHQEEADLPAERHRTVITVVSRRSDIKKLLEREEYLNRLVAMCKFTDIDGVTLNDNSYIDLEIRIAAGGDDIDDRSAVRRDFSEAEMNDFCAGQAAKGVDIYSIDTRNAYYASQIYELGCDIHNLPDEDIHSADRYALALDTFKYRHLPALTEALMKTDDLIKARECLSNIFCADCFGSRTKAMELSRKDDDRKMDSVWKRNNNPLSRSEHSRWVVEKLIMGYRPLSAAEHYRHESLSYDGAAQRRYRKILKASAPSPAHIDLCSYRDLRRINPADMKYDSFLMLAIPHILAKTGK